MRKKLERRALSPEGKFSKADIDKLRKKPRWEKYARFAISDLAIQKLDAAQAKINGGITEKGRTVVRTP